MNNYRIMKFGGSCLVTADDMALAAELVKDSSNPVVIASAMKGVTQELIELASGITEDERNGHISIIRGAHVMATSRIRSSEIRERAVLEIESLLKRLRSLSENPESGSDESARAEIMSYGERFSAIILKWYLIDQGINSVNVNSDEIIVSRDDDYLNTTVDEEASSTPVYERIQAHFRNGEVPVITGFFCRSKSGKVSLMGRNSSDYTASVVAYSIPGAELLFWKDVPGLMTADPKIVKGSTVIKHLSYDEAGRFIVNGARILHPMVIELAKRKVTTIRIRNFRAPESVGTLITGATPSAEPS